MLEFSHEQNEQTSKAAVMIEFLLFEDVGFIIGQRG